MIRSMTGFGCGEATDGVTKVSVELKSVNHRYLDLNIKMPRALNPHEAKIRQIIKEYAFRGKIDIFITLENLLGSTQNVRYNENVAEQYFRYLRQMADDFGIDNDIRVSGLSRYPEVFTMEPDVPDKDIIEKLISDAMHDACKAFAAARETEGEELRRDLDLKLVGILADVREVEKRGPEIVREYRERLLSKLREVIDDSQIDEQRVAQEMVIFSDKICTDEESVRLAAHIGSMRDIINGSGENVGRNLDFIAQEMNREANTMLSKANDKATTDIAIRLKTEIEKIREQIQNIE